MAGIWISLRSCDVAKLRCGRVVTWAWYRGHICTRLEPTFPAAHYRHLIECPASCRERPSVVHYYVTPATRDQQSKTMSTVENAEGAIVGESGAPAPPVHVPRVTPVMREGDVVILEQNGDKWAFVNLKLHQ